VLTSVSELGNLNHLLLWTAIAEGILSSLIAALQYAVVTTKPVVFVAAYLTVTMGLHIPEVLIKINNSELIIKNGDSNAASAPVISESLQSV
jgi:Sec-independent protein secretion pathway component TatC